MLLLPSPSTSSSSTPSLTVSATEDTPLLWLQQQQQQQQQQRRRYCHLRDHESVNNETTTTSNDITTTTTTFATILLGCTAFMLAMYTLLTVTPSISLSFPVPTSSSSPQLDLKKKHDDEHYLLQLEEWKHQIAMTTIMMMDHFKNEDDASSSMTTTTTTTTKVIYHDVLTTTAADIASLADDLQLQDDSQEQVWDAVGIKNDTLHNHHHQHLHVHYYDDKEVWINWWKNATDLERAWWNQTSHFIPTWEETIQEKTRQVWNESHEEKFREEWRHYDDHNKNHSKATTTTTTTTVASPLLLSLSEAVQLESLSHDVSEHQDHDHSDHDHHHNHEHDHSKYDHDHEDFLLYMNHSKAYSLLYYDDHDDHDKNQNYQQQYFSYQQGFDAQINQAYCGVATVAALLNSIQGIAHSSTVLPIDPVYFPYPYATQTSLLSSSSCVNEKVVRYYHNNNSFFDGILAAPFGLSLYQVQALLQCYLSSSSSSSSTNTSSSSSSSSPSSSWSVQVHHVIPPTSNSTTTTSSSTTKLQRDQYKHWIHSIRSVLIDALSSKSTSVSRVLINYDRSVLGQVGHGHFSPLASYHAGRDAFLILDVAKYKYPPVWVSTTKLIHAMATIDACSMWNFPQAQDHHVELTSPPQLLHPTSMQEYAQVMQLVGCQANYRGFIIVSKTT